MFLIFSTLLEFHDLNVSIDIKNETFFMTYLKSFFLIKCIIFCLILYNVIPNQLVCIGERFSGSTNHQNEKNFSFITITKFFIFIINCPRTEMFLSSYISQNYKMTEFIVAFVQLTFIVLIRRVK